MIGEPETLLLDSTLLAVLHPRQVPQGSGFPGSGIRGRAGTLAWD
jgi:hypothetical protein